MCMRLTGCIKSSYYLLGKLLLQQCNYCNARSVSQQVPGVSNYGSVTTWLVIDKVGLDNSGKDSKTSKSNGVLVGLSRQSSHNNHPPNQLPTHIRFTSLFQSSPKLPYQPISIDLVTILLADIIKSVILSQHCHF